MPEDLHALLADARRNFEARLAANPYPGRGLVIGRLASGDWLQLYWIMGRSANSRNRRFAAAGPELRTEPLDASRVEDPTNIIYEAMLEAPGLYIVSNGDHTRTVHDALISGGRFEDALAEREREDDAPNYTPRIMGLLDLREGSEAARVSLAILRANDADPMWTDRIFFQLAPPPRGLGYGLTTYATDGNPLPPFRGDPLWLPLAGDSDSVLDAYWSALDADNRIALAAKLIPTDGSASTIQLRGSGSERDDG